MVVELAPALGGTYQARLLTHLRQESHGYTRFKKAIWPSLLEWSDRHGARAIRHRLPCLVDAAEVRRRTHHHPQCHGIRRAFTSTEPDGYEAAGDTSRVSTTSKPER